MSKTIKNLKRGNYEVVDNHGVSVTTHFIECLEKEFADLESKLLQYTHRISDQNEEILELKQSQTHTAIDELEKMRKELDCEDNYCYGDNNIVICINRKIFNDFIDQQIKELRGE